MAWREELRPASFRGVPFFIETSQLTTGRRVSVHEYPDRDDPYPEDLGKVGNSFPLTGYVLGPDYFDAKKSLREAVEASGPGELVHPYWGIMQVQCGSVSFDEDKKEGGICKVTFQFYEAGNNKFPAAVDNKVATLFEKTKKALLAAKKEFDAKFNIIKMAGYAVDRARTAVTDAADLYQAATSGIEGAVQDIANLAYSVRNLKAEANDLLQAPASLSQRLFDSIALLEDAVGTPRGRLQAYASLFTFGESEILPPPSTPMRERDSENKQQFDNLNQRAALIGAVNQIPDIEFESTEEAITVRDQLIELIEKQLLICEDDDVFNALEDVQAQLVKLLPDIDNNLPNLRTVEVPTTLPSLVLTYDLFEKLDPELDLVERNAIAHPGFIIGGSELEVLNV